MGDDKIKIIKTMNWRPGCLMVNDIMLSAQNFTLAATVRTKKFALVKQNSNLLYKMIDS